MLKPVLAFALLALTVTASAAETDAPKAIAGLAKAPPAHPYLLFTADEKPAILKRIKGDRRSSEVFEKFLLEGRRLVNATTDFEPAPPREIHTRYIGSDPYRRYVAEHAEAAMTLAFLYQMTGDNAYAAKAFEHAEIVCAQESWVQSAHYFPVIYSRVWPYGARDDQVVFHYDITASGMTQRLAYTYDWLYPALTKAQRDRIRGALLEKAITRTRGNYEYHWWATAYKCNWSGICHTGLGLAALTLLHEDPNLVDVVARSHEGVKAMLDHFGTDGGWQEGRGYWAYGLGESVRFIEALKRATKGQVNLYQHRAISPRPMDFALFGLTGAFGDGGGGPVGESFVLNKLVAETGDPHAAWYLQNFIRSRDEIFDLLWPVPNVRAEKPAEASKHFPSVDWAFLRRDFSADSVTVATKAGMHDDPHHGHLDAGSFNITWQNLTFIGEPPRTPYDEKFFGAMRWDYLQARSQGHNVIMVNGEEQIVAKLKDQPWREGVGGKITQFGSEPAYAFVGMDNTKAYPGKELKGWQRWIVLDKETNVTVVMDRVKASVGSEIEARFHPGVEFEVGKDRVVLRPNSLGLAAAMESLRQRNNPSAAQRERTQPRYAPGQLGQPSRRVELEMVPLVKGEFSIVQGRQPDMPITREETLVWVPYISTLVKAPAEDTVMATIFCPADLRAGANFQLTGDAQSPAVTLTLGGRAVTYTFGADRTTRAAR